MQRFMLYLAGMIGLAVDLRTGFFMLGSLLAIDFIIHLDNRTKWERRN